MIRTEREYQDALENLKKDIEFMNAQQMRLEEMKLSSEEIERAMEPAKSFHYQLREEVEYYERIKRGDFGAVINLKQIGRVLIGLRIYRDMTQKELADRLGISEAQVSRDERNEYHGISIEKAQRIIDALNVNINLTFELPSHFPDDPKNIAV